MTCFWDGIRLKLNINSNNADFINDLKNKNNKRLEIKWNNTDFTKKQLDENYQHIKDFDEKNISNGYDCSICDPFLILICDIFNISINHNFNGFIINYQNNNSSKTVNFFSNSGHFW